MTLFRQNNYAPLCTNVSAYFAQYLFQKLLSINGPVVHPKNFKRLCMGGQSTPMFSIKYSRQLAADCYKSFTVLYSNSS